MFQTGTQYSFSRHYQSVKKQLKHFWLSLLIKEHKRKERKNRRRHNAYLILSYHCILNYNCSTIANKNSGAEQVPGSNLGEIIITVLYHSTQNLTFRRRVGAKYGRDDQFLPSILQYTTCSPKKFRFVNVSFISDKEIIPHFGMPPDAKDLLVVTISFRNFKSTICISSDPGIFESYLFPVSYPSWFIRYKISANKWLIYFRKPFLRLLN